MLKSWKDGKKQPVGRLEANGVQLQLDSLKSKLMMVLFKTQVQHWALWRKPQYYSWKVMQKKWNQNIKKILSESVSKTPERRKEKQSLDKGIIILFFCRINKRTETTITFIQFLIPSHMNLYSRDKALPLTWYYQGKNSHH